MRSFKKLFLLSAGRGIRAPRHGGGTGEPRAFAGACVIAADSSLRKRMRAARRGLYPVHAPSKKEMRRHAWRRRIEAAARLRIAFGQEWPGDRELLA